MKYLFDLAPLEELIFAVDFATPSFSSTTYGLYWALIRDDYPVADQERVPFVVGDQGAETEEDVHIDLPPHRRVWFESADGTRLIQLQRGRFMFNWRRKSQGAPYPEFESVFPVFFKEWQRFALWYAEISKTSTQTLKYELSYINTLDASHGWAGPQDAAAVLSFISIPWAKTPSPSVVSVLIQSQVPSLGELYIITRPKGGAPTSTVNRLEFRLVTEEPELELEQWFVGAREAVSTAFLESTTEAAQIAWGRKVKAGMTK